MKNLKNIKNLIKNYNETHDESFASFILFSLTYNIDSLNVLHLLSKDERKTVLNICNQNKGKVFTKKSQ